MSWILALSLLFYLETAFKDDVSLFRFPSDLSMEEDVPGALGSSSDREGAKVNSASDLISNAAATKVRRTSEDQEGLSVIYKRTYDNKHLVKHLSPPLLTSSFLLIESRRSPRASSSRTQRTMTSSPSS